MQHQHWTHEVDSRDEDVPGDDAHIAAIAAGAGPSVPYIPRIPLAHIVISCLPYSGAGMAEATHIVDHLADAGFHIVPITDEVANDKALASMANDLDAKDAQLVTAFDDRARALLMCQEAIVALQQAKDQYDAHFTAMVKSRNLVREERDAAYRDVGQIVTAIANCSGMDIADVLDSEKSLVGFICDLAEGGH